MKTCECTLRWLMVVLVVGVAGCGTGKYEERMAQRQSALKREEPFTKLTGPTQIPGTTVTLRIPQVLSRFATLDTEDATNPTGKISPERVKLSMLQLPGVFCVYDSQQKVSGDDTAPVSCQIAIIPKTAPEAAKLGEMLDAGLKAAFPNQAIEWQDVQAPSPQGDSSTAWKMVRIESDLVFDIYPADTSAAMRFERLPAVLEIWWHEDPGNHYHTLLVWRAPKAVEDTLHLMEMAPLTAGTIAVEAPAAAEPAAEPAAEQPAA